MTGTNAQASWLDQAKNLMVDLDGTLVCEDEVLACPTFWWARRIRRTRHRPQSC
jgi:hypothetical protein